MNAGLDAAVCPGLSGPLSRRHRHRDTALRWLGVGVVIVLYVWIHATLILRHTAIPYFDQANYIAKTYHIADALRAADSAWRRLDPRLYLDAPPAIRPPLMMMPPAMLLGPDADPRSIALMWLAIRVGLLITGLILLARLVGHPRFVLPALMLILCGHLYMTLNPYLYMMDQIFAGAALVAFGLVVRDMRAHRFSTAIAAGAGLLGLWLIKPAALVFMAPVVAGLAVQTAFWVARAWPTGERRGRLGQALRWASAYALVAASLLLLSRSSYGDGVRWLYGWGTSGWWASAITPAVLVQAAALAVPPALLLVLLAVRPFCDTAGEDRWLLGCAIATVVWWYVFNVGLAYALEARIVAAVSPLSIAVALATLTRPRRLASLVTVTSVLVVAVNVGGALDLAWARPLRPIAEAFGPPPAAQHPIAEVGLIPLVRGVCEHTVGPHAPPAPVPVIVAINDDFVESGSLSLAMRQASGNPCSAVQFRQAPWGSDLDLLELVQHRWFLSKEPRAHIDLRGDASTALQAIHRLLTHADTPLRPFLERRLVVTLRQPAPAPSTALEPQTVTLWHLGNPPPAPALHAALVFVRPMFEGTTGAAVVDAQRARVARGLAGQAPVGTVADTVAAADPGRAGPSRRLTFGNRFVLSGVALRRSADGLQVEMTWHSLVDQTLDGVRFLHILDRNGAIVAQADEPQDVLRGRVDAGAVWRDVVTVPAEKLRRAARLGLGILLGNGHMLRIEGEAPADWDRHRLLIEIAP